METLRAELERHFTLVELRELASAILALDPDALGDASSVPALAGALVAQCAGRDALEALAEAILALRPDSAAALRTIAADAGGNREEVEVGSHVGTYLVVRKLGEGRISTAYQAREGTELVRLRVFHSEAIRDGRGVQRFLVANRLAARVQHPGIPSILHQGRVAGRFVVATPYREGQTLAQRIARSGPMHINEALPILSALVGALQELHAQGVAHGSIHTENVLLCRAEDGQLRPQLLDLATDRLRARPPVSDAGYRYCAGTVQAPATASPEQLIGLPATPASDAYALGALLFELLTGQPVFGALSPAETAAAHLTRAPRAPSAVAPRGWVSRELDVVVATLLAKDPSARPAGARDVLDLIQDAVGPSSGDRISRADLDQLIDRLVADPESPEATMELDGALDRGARPRDVAEGFAAAADAVDLEGGEEAVAARRRLLLRAARMYEAAQLHDQAEMVFGWLLELTPSDPEALRSLEQLRRKLGKHEELVELLLQRVDGTEAAEERAVLMAEIGEIYRDHLGDDEQALVAMTQAYCEAPLHREYARAIEALAGREQSRWEEVLSSCIAMSQSGSLQGATLNAMYAQMGSWYLNQVGRPDLAQPVFTAVLEADPNHDGALEGLSQVLRRNQQWGELGMLITRRADAAADAAQQRSLRCEAAELLEHQLNEIGGARDIYEQVLRQDPAHLAASEGLLRILDRTADYQGLVRVLQQRAELEQGARRASTLTRVAQVLDGKLGDMSRAIEVLAKVLEEDSESEEALRLQADLLGRAGRHGDLIANLRQQEAVASTPRAKVELLERVAHLYDAEFFDHQNAADCWEAVLLLDPAREEAFSALPKHYRVLERWQDLADLLERHYTLVTGDAERLSLALQRAKVLAEQLLDSESAMAAYELVLTIDPEHRQALEALARLREATGDAGAAMEAILALADQAETPAAKAEQLQRAAHLLHSRADIDGAIELLKQALDALPTNRELSHKLRSYYVERGDFGSALQLIEHELPSVQGERSQAKLHGEAATLCYDSIGDLEKAERFAKRAVQLDPTNMDGCRILGDIAYAAGRFHEAASQYEHVADRATVLEKETAVRVLLQYVEALSHTGSTEAALTPMETLQRIAPENLEAMERVAEVNAAHGSPKRAAELYLQLLEKTPERYTGNARVRAELGDALRRAGRGEEARRYLEEAADLDPSLPLPLEGLAKLASEGSNWSACIAYKQQLLDLVGVDRQVTLLLEIADVASEQLKDRPLATKSLASALELQPEDRKILTRLMQLYSEDQDWEKLLDVVLRLAEFVEDTTQKANYYLSAALVADRQLADQDRALEYFGQVLAINPIHEKALTESLRLHRAQKNFTAVEELLLRQAESLEKLGENEKLAVTQQRLGELYEQDLNSVEQAVSAFEKSESLLPSVTMKIHLAELLSSHSDLFFDKAVGAQLEQVRANPMDSTPYKALRRLYTEAKKADGAWCLCQGMAVLGLADADEDRFYRRMRAETAAPARTVLSMESWSKRVMHPQVDPLLTGIFDLIQPAVLKHRGQPLSVIGLGEEHRVDFSTYERPMGQTLYYAAGVMGLATPPTYASPVDPTGLSFFGGESAIVVIGRGAQAREIPPQVAAFVAARHLAFYQPGMFMRHLVPTGTGLRAWLFAAIRLISPQFPIVADLEGPVRESLAALEKHLPPNSKDQLARLVSTLLVNETPLDLRKWIAGVDLTADRWGLVVAHDLQTAYDVVKVSDPAVAAVPVEERLKELAIFAVSEPFVELRQELGIAIDS